jgi:hypothetical protein
MAFQRIEDQSQKEIQTSVVYREIWGVGGIKWSSVLSGSSDIIHIETEVVQTNGIVS